MPTSDVPSSDLLLPGFVIAGVNKAGTTTLWDILTRHPGIAGSSVKETCYWLPLRYSGTEPPPLSTYSDFWAGADPSLLRMEATPGYFYGGRMLAERIDATCPGVRVLIVLREPSARLVSFFRYRQSLLAIPPEMSLREYVDRCRATPAADLLPRKGRMWSGVGGGLYLEHMKAWLGVFGDRARVVFFDDLVRDPRAVAATVCEWLELDPGPIGDLAIEQKNRTVGFRNERLQRLALKVNTAGAEAFRRFPAVKRSLRNGYRRVNGAQRPAGGDGDEAEVLRQMKQWYAEQNAGLRAVLEAHGVATIPDWVT